MTGVDYVVFDSGHLDGIAALAEAEGWPSFRSRDRVQRVLTAPGVTTVVAVDDGRVVGFAQLQSDGEVQAHLSTIAVAASHRGRGIGRELVREALRLAGGERVDLISEAPGRFYESFPHRRKPGYRLYPRMTPEDIARVPPAELIEPEDLREAAAASCEALQPHTDRDWSVRAGDLDWDCRKTADHIVNALLFYSTHLAARATDRRVKIRNGDPDASPPELLSAMTSAAAILAEVAASASSAVRAFHPAGMADPTGFVAMGCDEILVHTFDIASGLGVPFDPAQALCERVLRRLFPWAPQDEVPWRALLWANGRMPLNERPRLGPDWYWQCAPLDEWDGTVKRRTVPPAWT